MKSAFIGMPVLGFHSSESGAAYQRL